MAWPSPFTWYRIYLEEILPVESRRKLFNKLEDLSLLHKNTEVPRYKTDYLLRVHCTPEHLGRLIGVISSEFNQIIYVIRE